MIVYLISHTFDLESQDSRIRRTEWSAPKLRTIGPDRSNGPIVRTDLMILLMVLDQSSYVDGLV